MGLLGSDAAVGPAAELPEPVGVGVSGSVGVSLEKPSDASHDKGVAASMGDMGGDVSENVLTQGVLAQAAGSVFPVVAGEETKVAEARLLHEFVATTDRTSGKGLLEGGGDEGGALLCPEAGSAGLLVLVTIDGDGDRHCGGVEAKGQSGRRYTIFSDSQAAIRRALHDGLGPGQQRAITEVASRVMTNNNHIWICWVPAHRGAQGNEMADEMAKEAAGGQSDEVPDQIRW